MACTGGPANVVSGVSMVIKRNSVVMKTIIVVLLLSVTGAIAGTFRVHYSIRGSGRDITVEADTSSEARLVVMDMFPGAVVTGVREIHRQ